MGACANSGLNCTSWRERVDDSKIKADPDIAGIGVRVQPSRLLPHLDSTDDANYKMTNYNARSLLLLR